MNHLGTRPVSNIHLFFNKISSAITRASGRPIASAMAFVLIIVWAISGLFFGFSDTWQLVINTGTTIITFLMVFVIQQSQNKDTMALQLKLNEFIASQKNASNWLIDIEDLTSDELDVLKNYYIKLAALSAQDNDLHSSHSIDEASALHISKKRV